MYAFESLVLQLLVGELLDEAVGRCRSCPAELSLVAGDVLRHYGLRHRSVLGAAAFTSLTSVFVAIALWRAARA